jgi:hypothetical protein
MMPTITVPGRRSSGIAASRAPVALTARLIASSIAVEPRGTKVRPGTSARSRPV